MSTTNQLFHHRARNQLFHAGGRFMNRWIRQFINFPFSVCNSLIHPLLCTQPLKTETFSSLFHHRPPCICSVSQMPRPRSPRRNAPRTTTTNSAPRIPAGSCVVLKRQRTKTYVIFRPLGGRLLSVLEFPGRLERLLCRLGGVLEPSLASHDSTYIPPNMRSGEMKQL